jgi:hypothetical protein
LDHTDDFAEIPSAKSLASLVIVFGYMAGSKQGRTARAVWAIGALLLLALVFAVGRVSAPENSLPDFTAEPGSTSGVTRGAELAASYPHSARGAALAVGAYQRALTNPALLRRGELKRRIEKIATPAYAPKMIERNQPGFDSLIAGPIGDGVREGIPAVYLGVPIAYHVNSYTPKRAQIQNYGFTLLGNSSTEEPVAYFGTGTVDVVWRSGRWLIAYSQGAYGPTPETGTPREGSEGFDLGELGEGFRPYGIAP